MTCCKKEKLRESQNPFAQAIYEKTVYHIRNYRDKLEKVLDQFAEYLLAEEQFKNHNVIDAML